MPRERGGGGGGFFESRDATNLKVGTKKAGRRRVQGHLPPPHIAPDAAKNTRARAGAREGGVYTAEATLLISELGGRGATGAPAAAAAEGGARGQARHKRRPSGLPGHAQNAWPANAAAQRMLRMVCVCGSL